MAKIITYGSLDSTKVDKSGLTDNRCVSRRTLVVRSGYSLAAYSPADSSTARLLTSVTITGGATVNVSITTRFTTGGLHEPVYFYWRYTDGSSYSMITLYDGVTSYINNALVGKTIEWYAEYQMVRKNSGTYLVRSGFVIGIVVVISE